MLDLKDLIKQRGNIRARLTLFEKYIESDKLDIKELPLRLAKLRDLSCTFDDIQSQIEMLDEDSGKQINEREITEDTFFKLIAKAQSMLDESEKHHGNSESSSNSISKITHGLKLPPIKIAAFNGETTKWLSFRDVYLSLIHNNENIDDVNKFHYLKSYLEGAAASVINSVSMSSNNYPIAWDLLCQRYNNKRILINEHIKCLFSIESLTKESDVGIHNLIDSLSKNLSALKALGEPTDKWDTIIIYLASTKLDSITARKWEEFRSDIDSPTVEQFYQFLRKRATVMETVNVGRVVKNEKRHSFPKSKSFIASAASMDSSSTKKQCILCKQDHKLYECTKLKSLPVEERIAQITLLKLCSNCLQGGHKSFQCGLSGCRVCRRRHNTLLHKQSSLQNEQLSSTSTSNTTSNNDNNSKKIETNLPVVGSAAASGPSTSISMSAISTNQVLLSTALVKVIVDGKQFIMRALLDCGSQTSFISEKAQKMIGTCKERKYYHCVSGLGNKVLNVTEHCNIEIQSMHKEFSRPVRCFVLPKITDSLPQTTVRVQELNIPRNIQLADPKFYSPSDIDLLLGADIFWELIQTARINLGSQRPVLLKTHLGWIVAGPTGGSYCNSDNQKLHCHFSKEIQHQLARFWELEEISSNNGQDGSECEKLFNDTTVRLSDGRFCVKIPLKNSTDTLGDSYAMAEKRLFQLERKFKNKPTLKQLYSEFIHEYEGLGHMTRLSKKPVFGCYLSHHAVIRASSETTKLRVVFDASAKTSSGVSFNDIQHVGPVVQDDLFSILLRYRQHRYVVSADVEKMYRQILVDPGQRMLQQILWREDPSEQIQIFQLNTVTYGTASAPFLSTRCLVQLAKECKDDKISNIIKHDFYVDDFLSGADTEGELQSIIESVTAILNSACLPLRKWRTNSPSAVHRDSNSTLIKNLDLSSQASSVLGLKWDPAQDVFHFSVDIQGEQIATKRSILSKSAKLFDPLGLLSLCTIVPKIILQRLWQSNLDWDEPVDDAIQREWTNFIGNLESLSKVEIPRCVLIAEATTIEIHTFSDASQVAYAATIYLRSIDSSGQICVRLLCAKTKVAPVKSVTIPRLELCGALLSARLSSKVLKALRCKVNAVIHWTDSTVVLGWLSAQACNLKTFVSNRVSEIQELTKSNTWRHVPGDINPADLASRGLNPKSIQLAKLWWEGPYFLSEDSSKWPQAIESKGSLDLPETKTNKNITTITLQSTVVQPRLVDFERFSRFTTMQRSIAYVLRYINYKRYKQAKITSGPFSPTELDSALNILIKQHQDECFSSEIKLIKNKRNLPSKSNLLSLSPFLNDDGILCVGGRIQNSNETCNKKHPILLDTKHNFTKLLFINYHKKLLHCGPQLLLNDLRNKYWPLKGRILARKTVNNCKLCRIIKAKSINPIMGNLPASRVTPSLPFHVSGVDFAGPFYITDRKGRGCRISKCYMCLFVCFSTKAVHLEVASDLTSDVFILCLRRFISRRGKPLELYCDNGTNFVGANNELASFLKSTNECVTGFAADEGITFKFSPAYSPHFGGLWEAGVKSAKYHTTRILGDKHLTFEELSTLFVQIEAILNSRPLSPLSSDPNDLNPLTPAHFLIGRPLTSFPSEALIDEKISRLDRYRSLDQMRQHFWERWRKEYLSELQQRHKWRISQKGFQEGDLVVMKEPNLPPLKWRMARIHKLYYGTDGTARVADVCTSGGTFRRAIHRLCPLTDSDHGPSTRQAFEGGEDVGAVSERH